MNINRLSIKVFSSIILFALGLITAISFSSELSAQSKKDNVFRLVLDPGHGGSQDLGKGTWYKHYREKHLTLALANKVRKLIKKEYPEVRILSTRDKDVYTSLEYRPAFASKLGADLFISIHVNHASSTSAWGTETFIMPHSKEAFNSQFIKGRNKSHVQQRNRALSTEFATLLEHEYRRMGRKSRGVKEGNLQVLRENAVPAVLTEVGFLSSAKDRQVICTRSGQDRIAKAIANAFSSYYKRHRKAPAKAYKKEVQAKAKSQTNTHQTSKNEQAWYRVQFMATSKWIDTDSKEFKRFGVSIHRSKKIDGLYRYMAGNYRTLYSVKKLRSKMRPYYKDCFIIKVNSKGERIEAIY